MIIDPYADFINVAVKEINRIGKILDYKDDFSNIFIEWLNKSYWDEPIQQNEDINNEHDIYKNSYNYWICNLTNDQFKNLADIALRFLTVTPSEAEAERFISVQRDIQGTKYSNVSAATIFARLVLRTSCKRK